MSVVKGRRWRLVFAACLLAMAQSAWAQADPDLGRARGLIDNGQAEAAYQLLLPALDQHAGDPAFDYLFALAAMDAGHVTQGVFALERVLAVEPQHPQARAELARAYLLLGELDNARKEFEAVKKTDPPAPVVATIDRFLADIDRRQGRGTQLRGFVAITGGFDSNVNSAQDANLLNVPLFATLSPTGDGTAQISNSGISQRDVFGQITAGGSIVHRLGPQLALIASGAVSRRMNDDQNNFDTADARASLGLTWQRGQNAITAAVQGSRFLLDGDQFRDALGAFAQVRHKLDESASITAYTQATALSYDGQRVRNANRYTAGGVYTKSFEGPLKASASLGLYAGAENERASGVNTSGDKVTYLGHRFIGANASARVEIRPDLTAFVNASVEDRRYGGTDPLFLVARGDTFYQLGAGLQITLARYWNLIPRFVYSRNDSNVALNDYDRRFLSLTVRRDFE